MDKLSFIRLSDKPGNVIQIQRRNHHTRRPETMILFSVGSKEFTFTRGEGGICWIAELAPYDKASTHLHPAVNVGNPGGYRVTRLELVWRHNATQKIKEFINA